MDHQQKDETAVAYLATAMNTKLARARAKGRSGWDTPECTQQHLSNLLREHVEKGDPVDVANYCAFLAARGEGIAPRQCLAQIEEPAAPAAVAPRGEYPHEQMDAMALDRYKVVPSNASMLWSHAVVAGDGTQQLYVGREVECQNMARKFAGAFLDGAFAFHSTAAAPTAPAAPALEAPAAPAAPKREVTDGTRTLLEDCISAIRDYAGSRPEEGESWESWFEAAFDLCQSRVRRVFDDHALAAAPQAPAAPVPWLPYLSDRADGVKGRYAIARHNPAGYREVWNLRRHCWSAFSDEVLTMDEALAILQKLTMPTAAPAAPAVPADAAGKAHDWRENASYGGEICAECGAAKGSLRGNAPCAWPPAKTAKRWPFLESPGEFTARFEAAITSFDSLLPAVHNVLIERPPTLVAAPAAPGAYSRGQHDADSRELRSLCIARDAARRERELARAEIAGLQASTGHLSALVDNQHALLEKAKVTMTYLHGAASPVDESRGDLDARIPASAFARFVDAHAELLHAMAQSPVAAPAAPAVDAETSEDAERFRAMANAALTDDEVFGRALDQHPDMGGDATIDDVRAMFDAARAAQAKEGGAAA